RCGPGLGTRSRRSGRGKQERHYQLLSELQALCKGCPVPCQQRLSYTILSDLALALIDGTVFEIVQGLLEIQHLTEKNLYNHGLKLQRSTGEPPQRRAPPARALSRSS
uniref:Uncharacterized protein n=1 Tax=Chelonoidis abingdonii TaxID=106734 RepID=A0A8C0IRL5_CHEAB